MAELTTLCRHCGVTIHRAGVDSWVHEHGNVWCQALRAMPPAEPEEVSDV